MEPLVSVLTPVYNADKYLAECIESVIAQTYQNWEYTIVNNCSTDRTLEIAQSYAARDPRIRVHDNPAFLDIIANHNQAFRLISPDSKYCKMVSADDWIYPDCIRQMVALAEANPSVGIVTAYAINDFTIHHLGMTYPETVVPGKEMGRRQLMGGPYLLGAPTSLLYRSDLVRSVDEFFPGSSPHADTAACYEYLDRCDYGFVHQILSYERVHTEQTQEKSRIINYYIAEMLGNLVRYGPKYLDADALQRRIQEHLARYYRFLARNLFRGRDAEFWLYHEREMAQAGYPFRRAALMKAFARLVLDRALNPKMSIEGAVRRLRDPDDP